jgi:diguanylate cyclase (GGDEF)-like protein
VILDSRQSLPYLERVKRLNPSTSVIILTDQASIDQCVRAMILGAEHYFKKPVNLESFKQAVKRVLDRKGVLKIEGGLERTMSLLSTCQTLSALQDETLVLHALESFLSQELRTSHGAFFFRAPQGEGESKWIRWEEEDESAHSSSLGEVVELAGRTAGVFDHSLGEDSFRWMERGAVTPALFYLKFHCGKYQEMMYLALSPRLAAEEIEEFENRLRILQAQIEVTGRQILQLREAEKLALVDDATGLYNTRYLHTVLDHQILHAKSHQTPFAVLFIDIDRFKLVNDTHGHLVGTEILHQLAKELRTLVRASDTTFRYGGDEFVAVLSPCDLDTGRRVAERIRQRIESRVFQVVSPGTGKSRELQVTVSIGVALFPLHASTKSEVIEAADHAMYAAKKKSRNTVFIYEVARVLQERET